MCYSKIYEQITVRVILKSFRFYTSLLKVPMRSFKSIKMFDWVFNQQNIYLYMYVNITISVKKTLQQLIYKKNLTDDEPIGLGT